MSSKLFIYDGGSKDDREAAELRFRDGEVDTLPATSIADLKSRMEKLRKEGRTYDRVLWQTHGGPGRIRFGFDKPGHGDRLDAAAVKKYFGGGSAPRLFPKWTKMYFDGCRVAAEPGGEKFMKAIGSAFLKNAGGVVIAWTSYGYSKLSWWDRFIGRGGHTVHPEGTDKWLYFGPGGVSVQAPRPFPPWPGDGDSVGMKF